MHTNGDVCVGDLEGSKGKMDGKAKVIFPSGGIYEGYFKEGLRHGNGKCTWPSGTSYEGDWDEGKMTGKGKYSWPTGTSYEGDWKEDKMSGRGKYVWPSGTSYEGDLFENYLHGIGTLTNVDGSVYRGSWNLNNRHGIGEQKYQNSDVYEGSWKENTCEGSGRCVYSCGGVYIGSWKSGKRCGRGVFKGSTGELYDGFWLNGFKHGSGFYRFKGGNCLFGTFGNGKLVKLDKLYMALSKRPSLAQWGIYDSHNDKVDVRGRISHKSISMEENWSLSHSVSSCDASCFSSSTCDEIQMEVQDSGSVVYEREYMQGVLIKERIMKKTGLNKSIKHGRKTKEAKTKSDMDKHEGHNSRRKWSSVLRCSKRRSKVSPMERTWPLSISV